MRNIITENEKKERLLFKLVERYYGKKAILNSWEQLGLMSSPRSGRREIMDRDYLRDLSHRVRSHQNDLAYRGADGFSGT